jgi:hypothetical protein
MLAIRLPAETEHKLADMAKSAGVSKATLAGDALQYWIESQEWSACRTSLHIPNTETAAALMESANGVGLTRCDSVQDLFTKLNAGC